jgi:hypothetical protein
MWLFRIVTEAREKIYISQSLVGFGGSHSGCYFHPLRYILPCSPSKIDRCFGAIVIAAGNSKQSLASSSTVRRAIAHAVSRRLPTAAARVRAYVRSCGICSEQSGTGEGFLRVLWFPLPILIPLNAPQSSSGAGITGQTVAALPI